MIIVLKPEASEREIDHVLDRLRELGLKSHISTGEERTIIGVIGDDRILQNQPLTALPGVESVLPILAPWKLVRRLATPPARSTRSSISAASRSAERNWSSWPVPARSRKSK